MQREAQTVPLKEVLKRNSPEDSLTEWNLSRGKVQPLHLGGGTLGSSDFGCSHIPSERTISSTVTIHFLVHLPLALYTTYISVP